MSDDKKTPQTIADDDLDAAQGAGAPQINVVEVIGSRGDDGAAHRASSHRRIQPVAIMKRVDGSSA